MHVEQIQLAVPSFHRINAEIPCQQDIDLCGPLPPSVRLSDCSATFGHLSGGAVALQQSGLG